MPEIYAIGAPDVVGPFKVVGAKVLAGTTAEDVKASVQTVYRDRQAALAIVTEDAAELAAEAIGHLKDKLGPAVLLIPSHRGSSGRPLTDIRELVARAVGIDLMAND